MGWLASLLGAGVYAPVAAGAAGVGILGITLYAERDKARRERDASAWSYVLDVADRAPAPRIRSLD